MALKKLKLLGVRYRSQYPQAASSGKNVVRRYLRKKTFAISKKKSDIF